MSLRTQRLHSMQMSKDILRFNKDVSRHLALASTTRLDIRLKRSLRPSFQRTRYRLQRQSASNLFVCAIDIQRVVGLGGLEPPASPLSGVRSNHLSYRPNVSSSQWWSQSGSNRRPPACKAGALPAELWPRCSVEQRGSNPGARPESLDAGHLCGRLTGTRWPSLRL
jgi:hypothetical protein